MHVVGIAGVDAETGRRNVLRVVVFQDNYTARGRRMTIVLCKRGNKGTNARLCTSVIVSQVHDFRQIIGIQRVLQYNPIGHWCTRPLMTAGVIGG